MGNSSCTESCGSPSCHFSTEALQQTAAVRLVDIVDTQRFCCQGDLGVESGHQQPCLKSSWHDTSSRREESGEGRGVCAWGSAGDSCVLGGNGRRDVYQMPVLQSSQVVRVSYILPLPHFHGNMAARARSTTAAKFIPTPPHLEKSLEPWSLHSAVRSGTEPYLPLKSSLAGPPSPASGVFFNLARCGGV